MKKTAIIGILVLIAMFVVTCDLFQPEDKVEYTDVEYSEDGSRVTLYLDGVGVPKTAAQRAMSTRLSKMAYDYLDVVFISGSVVARAQWELGQPAGISGVVRDKDYGPDASLLVAGLKSGKTLLGIGEIGEIDNVPLGSATPTISSTTKSVTYYLKAVKTGLVVDKPTTGADVATVSSFGTAYNTTPTPPVVTKWTNSTHTKLGNSYIPTYPLPLPKQTTAGVWDKVTAVYVFEGAPLIYEDAITLAGDIAVEPRFPRYQDNGRYKQLTATIDMKSTVTTPDTDFSNVVNLEFTPIGSGIFSFYIEIPVTVLSSDQGTNTGKLDPIKWKIRTGLGSELYSLDDGITGGGCVLMTIGELELEDWLEIQWEWLP